ncbi:hypothetical protein EYZ11_001782 [Aspergillus tanneri]|uniref:Uncharacterized protein n=1 Tax=Aspergillus tanneri TaxID=1220188 RepID=A0A4S3JSC4_9EURO|nr:uncharacterized protein ATNIH1004_007010 [Aspergillus tanneri]KAA8645591.1 hypothetical protein ATNIH1004_007010 [Aspergillus tanneri]THC98719.1 hypothetical protein EYZ11_001782 [Aspergillus tanneri]
MGANKDTFAMDDAHNTWSLSTSHSTSEAASLGESSPQLNPDSRLYHIYRTVLHHHYDVTSDKSPVFHLENSLFRPKKPDLTVHAGSDKNGPIVAVCKFLHFSRHLKLGLGDPQNINEVSWEDLVCQNYKLTQYRWQMTVRTANGPTRQSFLWKTTHSVGVDGAKPAMLSTRNYKLLDEQTGRIVAVFTSNSLKSFTKCGKLQIDVDYGQEFEVMVILTVLALYEKQRRRNNRNNSGGGGGGGGG